MPREVVTLQIGQSGNQIGGRFWELALAEHALKNANNPVFDDALSSFFRNVDRRTDRDVVLPPDRGQPFSGAPAQPLKTLRARAVLVDMECGVVNNLLRGPLADVFDAKQIVTDVSGAGNNWAHGHCEYGPLYRDRVLQAVRRAVELSDSLQCFLLIHSLGGGTGSGLGTYILSMLEEEFPEYFRFVSCVSPSAKADDVITSPYNGVLALNELIEHAHCVLPVNNDALVGIVNRIGEGSCSRRGSGGGGGDQRRGGGAAEAQAASLLSLRSKVVVNTRTPVTVCSSNSYSGGDALVGEQVPRSSQTVPFGDMNQIVAQMLNHLTASMRFEGSLNLDLNEISMNLVPYPHLHFLNSSLSPLTVSKNRALLPRSFDQMFSDVALSSENSLTTAAAVPEQSPGEIGFVPVFDQASSRPGAAAPAAAHPRNHITLAQAFLVRSADASVADVTRNVTKTKQKLSFLPFNEDAIKIGLCGFAPAGYKHSCLGLANNCGIVAGLFAPIVKGFDRLYKRRAHVHHYTQYFPPEVDLFPAARENVRAVMADYEFVDKKLSPPPRCTTGPRGGESGGDVDWPGLLFRPGRGDLVDRAVLEWLPRPLV